MGAPTSGEDDSRNYAHGGTSGPVMAGLSRAGQILQALEIKEESER